MDTRAKIGIFLTAVAVSIGFFIQTNTEPVDTIPGVLVTTDAP